jgi:polyisoprenoid-binding protein YceI
LAKIKWIIDPDHTRFQFKAKHIMITLVSGQYREYDGDIETEDEDFATAKISFRAIVNSLDTHDKRRDAYIKGPDFLDAEKYPHIFFESKNMEKAGDGFKLSGDLTIKDITIATEFDIDFNGIKKDSQGRTIALFRVKGTINRKLWGLIWNVSQETGGLVAREVVLVILEVQLVKQE